MKLTCRDCGKTYENPQQFGGWHTNYCSYECLKKQRETVLPTLLEKHNINYVELVNLLVAVEYLYLT